MKQTSRAAGQPSNRWAPMFHRPHLVHLVSPVLSCDPATRLYVVYHSCARCNVACAVVRHATSFSVSASSSTTNVCLLVSDHVLANSTRSSKSSSILLRSALLRFSSYTPSMSCRVSMSWFETVSSLHSSAIVAFFSHQSVHCSPAFCLFIWNSYLLVFTDNT